MKAFNANPCCLKCVFLPQEELVPLPGSSAGVNALGLVVFSVGLGLVIRNMKQQGKVLQDFFDSLNKAIMGMVAIVTWSAQVKLIWMML